ncbi:MAG: hypothetical protein A2452_03260 [Candidatus Firestonebacteria bacterium RIFOXYC2_FULL_39_67]|nr:MAG: hypothetical protein A2536_02675 [Candidatus Firestonebacteria bacterium RIFOXYD2_FULL_39_29]OGF53836.1 MAG: hypothetical protein A2497_08430 [Candidatus Firestonebacteria bacterium RifOxyC12_full_39_7]OGF55286.1 MAG: hypothetical protein A2452_03260 [Candidatus Firestonebacteria bacterium RIFOXYC2_FULL_39_67]
MSLKMLVTQAFVSLTIYLKQDKHLKFEFLQHTAGCMYWSHLHKQVKYFSCFEIRLMNQATTRVFEIRLDAYLPA